MAENGDRIGFHKRRTIINKARHRMRPGIGKDGGRVSVDTMWRVLKAIDSFSWHKTECWASYETLAEETGKSVVQVRRAVEALREAHLITVERKAVPNRPGSRVTCNHYSLNWEALQCQDRQQQLPIMTEDQSPTAPASNAHSCHIKRPLSGQGIATREPSKKPPPQESLSWAAAVEILRSRINAADRLVKPCIDRHWTPEQLVAEAEIALTTVALPENQRRFRNPAGAAFAYLRDGKNWPVDNVVTLDQRAAKERQRAKDQEAAQAAQQSVTAAQQAAIEATQAFEAKYGAVLDSMSHEDLCDLADDGIGTMLRAKTITAAFVREHLLKRLAEIDS